MAVENLLRLAALAERPDLEKAAARVLERHGGALRDSSRALPQMMSVLGRALEKPRQVVISGALEDPATREMLRLVRSRLRPALTLVVLEPGPRRERLVKRNPLLRGMGPLKGRPTAYVCVNFTCELPTPDLATVRKLLDGGEAR